MRFSFPALMFCSLAAVFSASTQAAEGESWEYSSTMKMEGMSLPAMKTKVCQEAGWKTPPRSDNQSQCQVKDYQKNGNKMSWKMECPEGSGRGEITLLGSDKFTGFTEFNSEDGKMRMDMSGRKLGSCDTATARTEVNGYNLPSNESNSSSENIKQTGADEGMKALKSGLLK
jgi:hypothetical protein